MSIRCLIVDDHTLFREGLRRLLESESGLEVVGEARDASEAIERALFLKPDVVLMDIGMPGLSSFEASRRITREAPGRRVIFLTMYEDEEYLLQCLKARPQIAVDVRRESEPCRSAQGCNGRRRQAAARPELTPRPQTPDDSQGYWQNN